MVTSANGPKLSCSVNIATACGSGGSKTANAIRYQLRLVGPRQGPSSHKSAAELGAPGKVPVNTTSRLGRSATRIVGTAAARTSDVLGAVPRLWRHWLRSPDSLMS
jgi:hypothetical protein